VLPVVLFHAGTAGFAGGFVGVDVFLVISGYLITAIIHEELRAGTFTLTGFYERRVRRILPALFTVLACCVPFALMWLTPDDLDYFARTLLSVVLFGSNVFFWRTTGYFGQATEENPLIHTWSLSLEEQYYFIFPAVVLAAWRLAPRWLTPMLVAGLIGSFALALLGNSIHPGFNTAFNFFMLPTRVWELLAGALLALHQHRLRPASAAIADAGTWLGLGLIALSIAVIDKTTTFPGWATLLPVLGSVLVLLCGRSDTSSGRLLASPAMVGIGLISYSLYLWHQPVLAFARIRSFEPLSDVALAILVALSFALAWASWRFVERPFRNRSVMGRTLVFRASAAAAAVLLALGAAGHLAGGLPGRIDPETRAILVNATHNRDARACMGRPGNGPQEVRPCVYFDGLPAGWAVLGNSHSNAAGLALAEHLRPRGIGLTHFTAAGCAPAYGFTDTSPDHAYCAPWHREAVERIAGDPGITDVLLAYRHWQSFERVAEGGTADEKAAIYRDGFERMARRFAKAGKRVHVLLPIPELPGNIDKLVMFGGAGPDRLSHTRAAYEAAFGSTIRWLSAIDGVEVVDPVPAFCDGSSCYGVRGGAALYIDDNHPSMAGARRITAGLP
jgi:peptidoglycan/LPS O-acetylase OafA/YrhL